MQFHPEVVHTEYGQEILKAFLYDVAGCRPTWTRTSIIDALVEAIRAQVGDERVICGLSGGVDSAVAAAIVHRAVGDQLTCVFVDTGMLREGEPDQVEETFRRQFHVDLVHVKAADRYLAALDDVLDPEHKRKIIGETFWRVFAEAAVELGDARFFVQGTLYPDVVESGATGGEAATIKSHHNLIAFPEGLHFELIEPLRNLFKDEVRAVGEELGLPEEIVWRQPFPGPGLGGPHRRHDHRRAARDRPAGGRDRHRRDPPRRPQPRAVAGVRRAARRPYGRASWATSAPTRTRSSSARSRATTP